LEFERPKTFFFVVAHVLGISKILRFG
jgi:hypothetical protein